MRNFWFQLNNSRHTLNLIFITAAQSEESFKQIPLRQILIDKLQSSSFSTFIALATAHSEFSNKHPQQLQCRLPLSQLTGETKAKCKIDEKRAVLCCQEVNNINKKTLSHQASPCVHVHNLCSRQLPSVRHMHTPSSHYSNKTSSSERCQHAVANSSLSRCRDCRESACH